jgi:Putative Actinobacterial Holin-X, holin superfamily III
MAQEIAKEDRSIGELFSELTTEAGTLIRQEIALAQTELTQKATKIGTNVGFLVVGGAVGYAALLVWRIFCRSGEPRSSSGSWSESSRRY